MERREEMTLSDFINAVPARSETPWYELIGVPEIEDAVDAGYLVDDMVDAVLWKFIRENRTRMVSVYWPEHSTRNEINSDCTCSFVD